MNIVGNEHEMKASNNYVSEDQINQKNWKPIREVPAIIFAKVGAAIMLNRKRLCRIPFLIDNNMMAYKFGHKWDIDFGKTLFDQLDLTSLVQVGALPSYNGTDIENMSVLVPPDKSEQIKIGKLFGLLDDLITLHQCKFFSPNSADRPKSKNYFPESLLFLNQEKSAGISLTWEQRKLGDLGSFHRGKNLGWGDVSVSGKNQCILYGELYTVYGMTIDKIFSSTNKSKSGMELSVAGDVLIPGSDTTPTGLARASSVGISEVILGGDINVIRPNNKMDGKFLSFLLNANRKKLLNLIVGTTVKHIYNRDLEELVLIISTNIEEQKRISRLFMKLDDLITLHQREQLDDFLYEPRKRPHH